MDRSLQKQVAQLYPKKNKVKAPRTPLRQALHNPPMEHQFQIPMKQNTVENFYVQSEPGDKIKPQARKILIVVICTILAGFIFSSLAYTISDGIANRLSLELFDENGNPGLPVIAIHTILFGLLMYLVLSGVGY